MLSLTATMASTGAHIVQEIELHPVQADGVTITEDADSLTIKVAGGPVQVRLGQIDRPSLRTRIYAVKGEVRYSQIAGDGYLEMWSVFPGGRYFTRTLGEAGPLARLTGDSAWRDFLLPFDKMGHPAAPGSLELNLILPHGGEVSLRHLVLKEFSAGVTLNNLSEEEGAHWVKLRSYWLEALIAGAVIILLLLLLFLGLRSFLAAWVCASAFSCYGLLFIAAGGHFFLKGGAIGPAIALGSAGLGTCLLFGLLIKPLQRMDRQRRAQKVSVPPASSATNQP